MSTHWQLHTLYVKGTDFVGAQPGSYIHYIWKLQTL